MVEQKIRKDIYIYNEATGFVITSACRNNRSEDDFEQGEPAWQAAIQDGSFLPITLVQDDSLVIRILVNDDLTEQEQEEWVDYFEWKLAVPDGKLVIAGGIEYMWDDTSEEYFRVIDLEPGTYKIEVYTLVPGVNGANCLESVGIGDDELEAYFTKTRPGEEMPEWLKVWLELDEDEDEDYEEDLELDSLVSDPSKKPPSFVDFLIRLTPLGDEQPKRPRLDEGWIDTEQKPRKPKRCPLGILAPWVEGIHDQPVYIRTELHYRAEVWGAALEHRPTPVHGGGVPLPIEDLALPYWIAWMCSQGAFVAMKVDTRGQEVPFEWPGLRDDILVTTTGGEHLIEFDGMNAKWAQPGRLRKLGELFKHLPDGCTIELVTAETEREPDEDDYIAGLHWYRGEVRGGVWKITETFPALNKETLEGALELARQVDRQEAITFRSEEELLRVQDQYKGKDFLLRESPPVRVGLALKSEKEPMYTALIGSWVLRERFGDAFVTEELDDDLQNWDNLMSNIEQAFAAPTTGEVVLKGRSGSFTSADLLQVAAVNKDEVHGHDRSMLEYGFLHVGDLVSSKFSDVVLRGYAHVSEPIYAVVIRNTFGGGAEDFYSIFEDGWSLTSTTLPAQENNPAARTLKQSADSLRSAYLMHRSGLQELAGEHGSPAPVEPTLVGLAEALDEYLVRNG